MKYTCILQPAIFCSSFLIFWTILTARITQAAHYFIANCSTSAYQTYKWPETPTGWSHFPLLSLIKCCFKGRWQWINVRTEMDGDKIAGLGAFEGFLESGNQRERSGTETLVAKLWGWNWDQEVVMPFLWCPAWWDARTSRRPSVEDSVITWMLPISSLAKFSSFLVM